MVTTTPAIDSSELGHQSARCRICESALNVVFADLGHTPLANSYLTADQLQQHEPVYPLKAFVCEHCLLVQLQQFEQPQVIFNDYAYFSSYSDSWLQHASQYAEMAVSRFGLGSSSQVIEVGSNDGYLLQYLADCGARVLGVEPAANVARAATDRGIATRVDFFSSAVARQLIGEDHEADLLIGNNVLAHVPTLRDFVKGLKILLGPRGVITLEFPHLLRLTEQNQFDTIYHEHFSYFSLLCVRKLFQAHGLTIFDVDQLPTHGGSLRIYLRHTADCHHPVETRVADLLDEELRAGMDDIEFYRIFGERIDSTRRKLVDFVRDCQRQKRSIVAYGAPAKGNTLLNYCNIGRESIQYTVDRSPHKQNCYLPGSRIPIFEPDAVKETKPDFLLVLPWNLKDEIIEQMSYVRDWGCRFVVPIPELAIVS